MLKSIFTLDYEIHGNGEGCPHALMVEPTERMMRQFERYGAKLTIMADIGEILKFREYAREQGRDDYHYEAIASQLKDAIRRGHDVQLHIHCSYFNARCEGGKWRQDWSEYNFAGLPLERQREVIRIGKEYLEGLLRPVDANYRCEVFRAANWSVSPSQNVVQALLDNGLRADTSIFKYGKRSGLVNFDYTNAASNLAPWKADANDLCRRDENGKLWEYPIYSEHRRVGAFLTPMRMHRAVLSKLHRFNMDDGVSAPAKPAVASAPKVKKSRLSFLTRRHAWKADFNQCSGRQLIAALERAEAAQGPTQQVLPFVLIGHSKIYSRMNERSLKSFLAYVAARPERFGFARFCDLMPKAGERANGKAAKVNGARELAPCNA